MSEFSWVPSGCIPDLPDFRDWSYERPDLIPASQVDLRHLGSVIEDQGMIGSCTSNAVVGAIEMLINKLGRSYEDLSRLFIFYNTRSLDGTISNGDILYGSSIRNAIKSCVDIGVCTEAIWPYTALLWNITPNYTAYSDAIRHRVTNYYSLTPDDIRYAVSEGYGVIFGLMLYSTFNDTPATGIVQMPDYVNDELNDGHAMTIVGYNDDNSIYIVRNSWGTSWGNNGYCFIPYDYVHDKGFSFWIIKQYYGELSTPDEEPGLDIVTISPQPESGTYYNEQTLTFYHNMNGEIRVSVDSGTFFTYSSPIPIVKDTDIVYYYKYSDGRLSDKQYLSYSIDLNPLVITPSVPSGTYRAVKLTFDLNIPGDVYIYTANDSYIKYDNDNPWIITDSQSIVFYGVSSTGKTYPSKVLKYVIDQNAPISVSISPEPERYYRPFEISLTSYTAGNILYYLASEPGNIINYAGPFTLEASNSVFYKHEEMAEYTEAIYTIKPSSILYRINGGPWIDYIGPIRLHKFSTIEAVAVLEDGSHSDIAYMSYTIIDADQYWVVVA